ncbi:transposase [Tenuifilaceae bacterium CYCD]|nr:transposase [Tenuifilaceae bacterium CYCD]BDX37816.1 transposase [Tenuifilaceae bacterium CYCD]BDX38799.1 transposase [Tenuifilaceae bacterium CYCD]
MEHLFLWLALPRSVYYYRPSNRRKGVYPSQWTNKRDGTLVGNTVIIDEIKRILCGEFVCYGYQNVTMALKSKDFIINHKKVYRLMDENNLLLGKVIRTQGKREWVKFRKINASKPMEYLCWDIKYVWVPGERKNYYLLSLMDVYTRRILDWIFQGSIRKVDVIKMINRVNLIHDLKGVTVRNDNGSQFIANKVRHYLRTLEANQEFTHIATPEENSYIEAFHSLLEREVIRRHDFAGFYDAKLTISAYMKFYNNERLHGALKRVPPMKKWNEYYLNLSSDKPTAAQVSEEMSRVSDGADTGLALDISGDTANFADRMMNENQAENKKNNLNCFQKNVQLIGG